MWRGESAVHVLSVPNTRDADNVAGIVNDVHDTPIPDAYPPMILVIRQFLGSDGSRLTGESLDFSKHTGKNVIR